MRITIPGTHFGKVVCKPVDVFKSYRISQQTAQVIQSVFQLLCRVTSVMTNTTQYLRLTHNT